MCTDIPKVVVCKMCLIFTVPYCIYILHTCHIACIPLPHVQWKCRCTEYLYSCTVTNQLSDWTTLHTCKEIIIINPLFFLQTLRRTSMKETGTSCAMFWFFLAFTPLLLYSQSIALPCHSLLAVKHGLKITRHLKSQTKQRWSKN